MPVIDPALTFGGAPDFAAALGLRPSTVPEPELAGGTALDGPSALDGEPAGHAPAPPEHGPPGNAIPRPRSATDWLSVAYPAPVDAPNQADGPPEDDQSEDVRPEDDPLDGEPAPEDHPAADVPPAAGHSPDAAFETVTGWRPQGASPARPKAKPNYPAPPPSDRPSALDAHPVAGWKSVGDFRPGPGYASAADLQSTSEWTSFGDFQPPGQPVPSAHDQAAAFQPAAALQHTADADPNPLAEQGYLVDPLVLDQPSLGRHADESGHLGAVPLRDASGLSTSVWQSSADGASDAAASADPATRVSGIEAPEDIQLLDRDTVLAGETVLVGDLEPPEDSEPTTVLKPVAAHRLNRRRIPRRAPVRKRTWLSRRPGARIWALVAGAVVGLIVGATALVGVGKSFWSAPNQDATHTTNPPPVPELTPAPPPPAPAPPAPAPPAAAPPNDAQARAKAQADAAAKAAEGAGAGAGDSVLSLANCTKRVGDGGSLQQAIGSAAPGQKICAVGNMGATRLQVNRSGTPNAPIMIVGNGSTPVKGITVDASNVVVAGFSAVNPQAPGIELTGNNITVRNNTVKHPTGGDYDGLRFFGSNLKILNNTISDVSPDGSGAHADCMQSYATDPGSPASQNVLIDGNKCQRIDNQCLIAEGPNSSAGDGSGQGRSANITFTNNFCEVGASQALQIDDVQGVKVTGNTIAGRPDKAFSFQNKSTGAVVAANKIAAGIGYQVGMDSSSRTGYQGPTVGGGP
ncbi:MAG TPA: right-handed parallel beta-helix repeat-containing protein [Pseudonocardia sp.]|uniref:right-handed parallel beta-helix repeat-containing protein n=1 Tax=Pseudonocardia sp. TaxID=60912 RepID=UPI002BA8648B|nr:right-handed parallel beta-helix repeat-containing protein [Pseudonocardia sp.]HTF47516.1 right-handed parallel beta-helix repeat-containing protein [Pseudonocardia sp.]